EDGMRVFHVTGVQTCALPISGRRAALRAHRPAPAVRGGALTPLNEAPLRRRREGGRGDEAAGEACAERKGLPEAGAGAAFRPGEIGRASCRARVETRGVAWPL